MAAYARHGEDVFEPLRLGLDQPSPRGDHVLAKRSQDKLTTLLLVAELNLGRAGADAPVARERELVRPACVVKQRRRASLLPCPTRRR